MTNFIRAKNCRINLAHVRLMESMDDGQYRAIMNDGEIVEGIEDLLETIISTVPVHEAWECLILEEMPDEPYTILPVISWGRTLDVEIVPILPSNMKMIQSTDDYGLRKVGHPEIYQNFVGICNDVDDWLQRNVRQRKRPDAA
jgi:hypothetical protein